MLALSGEFDWSVIGHVEGALEQARALAVGQVVFDLRPLEVIDLAGLRAILRAHDSDAFDVIVVRPRGFASRVFTLTRVSEELTMVDSW